MRYVRLLKDTPQWEAGTAFEKTCKPGTYADIYEAVDGSGHYTKSVVDGNSDWFEEVMPIYVRPYNAVALQQLDSEVDGVNTEIGGHIHVRA